MELELYYSAIHRHKYIYLMPFPFYFELLGYVLKISDNGMSKSISVNQTVTTYLFTGLSPDTLYKIKIAVENEFGRGPFEVINNRGISVKTSEDCEC